MGLCLAQLEVLAGTGEGTAFIEAIEMLDVAGAMLSGDALHAQKETTAKVVAVNANFTFTLKNNQPTLLEQAEQAFATNKDVAIIKQNDKNHGRITAWEYSILEISEAQQIMLSKKGWAGIKAFGRCKCMSIRDGKETTAIRYYILSYSNLELFAKTSRNHWAIENNLHWV